MPSTIGIYKIVNKVTRKYYIGSSLNTSRRWREHTRYLTNNNHCNDYLQNAWNKYGPSAFEFVVITVIPSGASEADILLEEQKWLDKAANDPLSYNLTFVAGRPTANLSEYSKKKRSESLKRVPRTPEWKAKISKSHFGIRPTAATLKKMSLSKIGKKQTDAHRNAATESRKRHWDFVSPTGEAVHIYDLKQFSRDHGLHPGAMYWVFSGKRARHKGWTKTGGLV
jgi:group I intron endonuclease